MQTLKMIEEIIFRMLRAGYEVIVRKFDSSDFGAVSVEVKGIVMLRRVRLTLLVLMFSTVCLSASLDYIP